jgi:3-hydroxymyristoyl/3-hydroxydecanoyl-(acyl carrier protein) dehydratase
MHYLFADRILDVDAHGAGTITTVKVFAQSEEYFDGTFRPRNEVPSSLVLEAMATAGSFLLTIKSRYRIQALLLKVGRAAFPSAVRAGDRMTVRARVAGLQGGWGGELAPGEALGVAEIRSECLVDDRTVAEAVLMFLGLPMDWTLGARQEQILSGILEQLGYIDSRP